jgi:hypothetical protein
MFPLEHNDLGYGKHYFLNAPNLGYENFIIEMHLTHNPHVVTLAMIMIWLQVTQIGTNN